MRIKIHSLTDLITNSSTVIYTYSDRSPAALKEMINEIFKVLGVEQKCDDVFDISVVKESGMYTDWICDNYADEENPDGVPDVPEEFHNWRTCSSAMEKLITDIASGGTEKPKWFLQMEEEIGDEDDYNDGYPPETTLQIVAKDLKYEKLAQLVINFLYSTHHEATRDG